ncbi:hypothetical protein GCM10011348_29080 [Marinobacterium nitratireducens]|uniref:DUF2442 domain-containing protein n=1 Tax=Marinobacterium nitratireducens TaxID=518897 RepID=A0A917ZKY2_9GAMM|nr:DUF2442 domain-containing protein [Marinobacterium nitratireducens]GGO83956.1 hypothetical protein GCM10011348_29080 [Marinobacterium nitratireducens]
MIRVVDVDYIDGFRLHLVFSDGFAGEVDLADEFSKSPFDAFAHDFKRFALADGTLCWGDDGHIAPEYLREVARGDFTDAELINPTDPASVLSAAFRDSIEEGDITILQAAIRGFSDELGMARIVEEAGIKSRPSAYKTISSSSPKLETIVKMCHAILKIDGHEERHVHRANAGNHV